MTTPAELAEITKEDTMKRCKTCKYFERGKWHESLGGGEQHGGNCPQLLAVLQMENSALALTESLYLQDTFGCFMHKPNQGE